MKKILQSRPPGSGFRVRYTYGKKCPLHPKYNLRLVVLVSGEH